MNSVNKTMYIPLYGKALVSKKGLFLEDEKAEEIWEAEGFPLKGKSKSKWLAYYMGVRSAVFDDWLKEQLTESADAIVFHIGCGMDSRIIRVGDTNHKWFDVDFPDVIAERKKYYTETENSKMISTDIRDLGWIEDIPESKHTVVVMEGVSMYLPNEELCSFLTNLCSHFDNVSLLMDCYSILAAKISRYKNPINDVGVTKVYGIDDPCIVETNGLNFIKEHEMTPQKYIDELCGIEKKIFEKLYAGSFSKKLYRLFEYKKC